MEEEAIQRQVNYYSVIPANVRYCKDLKPNEKLLYSEITALSNKEGYCYATNKYFAELFKSKPNTVSGWISHLEKLGFIHVELIKTQKNQIIQRRIYLNDAYFYRQEIEKEGKVGKEETEEIAILSENPDYLDNTEISESSSSFDSIEMCTENHIGVCDKNHIGVYDKNHIPISFLSKENNINNNIKYINNKKEKIKKEKAEVQKLQKQKEIKNENEIFFEKMEYDEIINERFPDNSDLKNTIYDFIKMRKTIKKPITSRGLLLMLNKLNKLSSNPQEQQEILENSIMNSYQGIFPINKVTNFSTYTNQKETPEERKIRQADELERLRSVFGGGE